MMLMGSNGAWVESCSCVLVEAESNVIMLFEPHSFPPIPARLQMRRMACLIISPQQQIEGKTACKKSKTTSRQSQSKGRDGCVHIVFACLC